MPTRAKSLKLPADKSRHKAFIDDSIRADKEMQASGLGYAFEDVAAYIRARIAGKTVKRPKPNQWRK